MRSVVYTILNAGTLALFVYELTMTVTVMRVRNILCKCKQARNAAA